MNAARRSAARRCDVAGIIRPSPGGGSAQGDETPAGGGQRPALVWRGGGTPCAWLAMAVTIMFGLALATVLTLIVVPLLYAAFYRVPSPSPA